MYDLFIYAFFLFNKNISAISYIPNLGYFMGIVILINLAELKV